MPWKEGKRNMHGSEKEGREKQERNERTEQLSRTIGDRPRGQGKKYCGD